MDNKLFGLPIVEDEDLKTPDVHVRRTWRTTMDISDVEYLLRREAVKHASKSRSDISLDIVRECESIQMYGGDRELITLIRIGGMITAIISKASMQDAILAIKRYEIDAKDK